MKEFPEDFLIGASTAAHQVEGNNIHSDFWAMEHMKHTAFTEPSLDAVDHYHRYQEDIGLLADAGLNAYRFSIEWARIEPEQGAFDDKELEHYREVIHCCRKNGVEPIITMHHFSSPKWLIAKGGWESENTIDAFVKYCSHVIEAVGDGLQYVCTINEANMGLQMAAVVRSYMKNMGLDVQVGINPESMPGMKEKAAECMEVFGTPAPRDFLSMRTEEGDRLIMRAHTAAREAMKKICPHLKIGITLSLHDFQPEENEAARRIAAREWEEEFLHYLPFIKGDDFFGLQNYTRKLVGANGTKGVPEGAERTQMNYEYYPEALEHVIRKTAEDLKIPIMVTENGIATEDDGRRIAFINTAMESIQRCIQDGIPVLGYMHWSLLDNFEWQLGFQRNFGLIAVDRGTQKRFPKESLKVLGGYVHKNRE